MEHKFRFEHAKPEQRALLHGWFAQEHIQAWMHGEGLQNTIKSLDRFFQEQPESWSYWVGYDNDTPFAFLITSQDGDDAITLDVFICDLKYIGRGLAEPLIKQFLTTQFPHIQRVLIDPEATNTRAIHVYEKVGFRITGEFIAPWDPVPHYQMELDMKSLLSPKDI